MRHHQHRFLFPEDLSENYNRDGITLTGVCKCGKKKKDLGVHGLASVFDEFYSYPTNRYKLLTMLADNDKLRAI